MSNKKQTAVEWLVETIDKKYVNAFLSRVIEQAKEMEKQQIIETARFYFHERGKAKPEQYYKEEYGS